MAGKSSKKGKIKQSDSTKHKSVAQSVVSGEVHKEYAAELNKTSLIEARELQKQDGLKKDNTNTFKERGQLTGSRRKPFLPALLEPASKLLGAAFGVALLLVLASLMLERGDEAVLAMGGFGAGDIPKQTAQWAFFLDVLFPFFYGGGLILLIASFQNRGNRPLVRLMLTSLLLAVAADFLENALVFKVIGGDPENVIQFPLTVLKYGGIAFAGVLFTAIMPVDNGTGRLLNFLLRYAFPAAIAFLVSGIGGDFARQVISACFPAMLLLLAIYAKGVLADTKS